MPCGGCQRRKAALIKAGQRVKRWMRKTPALAREAILRRVRDRVGVRDGV